MQIPWGDWGIPFVIIVVIILLWTNIKTSRRKQKAPKAYLVTVEGTIEKILPDDTDARGGKHQRFFLRIIKVLDNPHGIKVETHRDILVAVRYGDRDGMRQRVKSLDSGLGKPIELRGKYIHKEHDPGSRDHDVLHFTHKPIGYIRLGNKTYR